MVAQAVGPYLTEWWMEPGEYWRDGLVCRTEDLGSAVSTYCRYEPNIAEKLWDWNWQHVVEPTFPIVWVVLLVLSFIWTASASGWFHSRGGKFEDYGWKVCLPTFMFGVFGFLWQAYIAAALVFSVWFGIFWLTGKSGRAALLRRQASARLKRQQLRAEASALEKLVEPLDGDEAEYKQAAMVAVASLRAQAREVKS